jgi:hypothetical protein
MSCPRRRMREQDTEWVPDEPNPPMRLCRPPKGCKNTWLVPDEAAE